MQSTQVSVLRDEYMRRQKTDIQKNIYLEFQGKKLRDNKAEANFKETMAENFPKGMEDLVIRYKSPESPEQDK